MREPAEPEARQDDISISPDSPPASDSGASNEGAEQDRMSAPFEDMPSGADELLRDPHSAEVVVGVLDPHSAHLDAPAPRHEVEAKPQSNGATPVAPVVEATAHAAHVAADAARQATHQVEAAVQQQAQRITVAPRKAIYRGKRFLLGYGVLVALFGVLAMLARRYKYFPADVGIARVIQKPQSRLWDQLMHAVSQLGWRWTSVAARAITSVLMWIAGFRLESAFTLLTWSGDVVSGLIKITVLRPRPTRELVRVVSDLKEASFPSGHVVHYVTFYGFLFYLVFTHIKEGWLRKVLLSILGGIVMLVGPSRVYMGHHWPSDVAGAYFVGNLWLGVIVISYLETKANFTLHTHPPFFVKRPRQLG